MEPINRCPSTLAEGFDTYSPAAIRKLFSGRKTSHIMDFSVQDEGFASEIARNVGHMSLSGVHDKLSAVWSEGKVMLAPEGMSGTYILKPIPTDRSLRYRNMMPANEHLTMQIAEQVYGISTAANGLIFLSDDTPAYLAKRFDVAADGRRIKQEDFASLLGLTVESNGNDFKYKGSYLEMASVIRQVLPAWPVELAKFFRLVVFNYIFGNGDAHLKNFSVQQTEADDYILAPAYDLINSSLHVADGDFALEEGILSETERSDTYRRSGHPCREDFATFGRIIGLNETVVNKILIPFSARQEGVYRLTDRSFLDKRMQRMYLRSYEERMNRFLRG